VTREAHHAARDTFNSGISAADRRADIDAALKAAVAAGIGLAHENGGPAVSSEADFADVLGAGGSGLGPQVIGYWGELVGDQESALVLAGRQEHVELARIGVVTDRAGQGKKLVGGIAHRGHDHDQARATGTRSRDPAGDTADTVGVGDRRPAEFLDDDWARHGRRF